jgi:UDP-N-acetylglucosamine 2-epimerase (non-hydrolysing)
MKILLILGTRPEAIKMAPLIIQLQKTENVQSTVLTTGQHREMLEQALNTFGIQADANLDNMTQGQSLSGLTSKLLSSLDLWLETHPADLVLVQGDTNSAFAGALAAFNRKIPVGHVEAGLRTRNLLSPWPEEANRQMISRIANLHFAPTESARQNLLQEGIPESQVYVTGNTVADAARIIIHKILHQNTLSLAVPTEYLQQQKPFVLITAHRRENFGAGFEAICRSIQELARRFPDVGFVFPVHLNPNVREPVKRILSCSENKNIILIDPVDYISFMYLFQRAKFLLTDSGGIQEEAPSLGKPVLLMRDTTERPEAVECGSVKLVGTDFDKIVDTATQLLTDDILYAEMAKVRYPFGDGYSSERIVNHCIIFLQ